MTENYGGRGPRTRRAATAKSAVLANHATAPIGLERLKAASLTDEFTFLAGKVHLLSQARIDQGLNAVGLKVSEYWVLASVCNRVGPSQRELADSLSLCPSRVVSLIDRLQERRAVVRMPDPEDRRSNVVSVTPKGRHLCTVATFLVEESERQSLSRLSGAERTALRLLLQRLLFP